MGLSWHFIFRELHFSYTTRRIANPNDTGRANPLVQDYVHLHDFLGIRGACRLRDWLFSI